MGNAQHPFFSLKEWLRALNLQQRMMHSHRGCWTRDDEASYLSCRTQRGNNNNLMLLWIAVATSDHQRWNKPVLRSIVLLKMWNSFVRVMHWGLSCIVNVFHITGTAALFASSTGSFCIANALRVFNLRVNFISFISLFLGHKDTDNISHSFFFINPTLSNTPWRDFMLHIFTASLFRPTVPSLLICLC